MHWAMSPWPFYRTLTLLALALLSAEVPVGAVTGATVEQNLRDQVMLSQNRERTALGAKRTRLGPAFGGGGADVCGGSGGNR